MEENIQHVHEVIYRMQEENKEYTEEELLQMVWDSFGKDVQFVACSGIPFPNAEVIEFLLDRRKIVIENGKISLHPHLKLCDSDKK
ncbi:MAG: YecH family protein [Cytophagales bacterium]|nr:YecH family protein [Cytophagales bacterium]